MLKRLLATALLAIGLVAFVKAGTPHETHLYNAGVVLFEGSAHEPFHPVCSGTVVAKHAEKDYLILTAAHCVAVDVNDETIPYTHTFKIGATPDTATLVNAQILAVTDMAQGGDLAILEAVGADWEITPISKAPIQAFESLEAVETPMGFKKIFATGQIVSTEPINIGPWKGAWLAHVGGVAPGASGGAVYCESEEKVCGVLVGLIPDADLSIIEPVRELPESLQ